MDQFSSGYMIQRSPFTKIMAICAAKKELGGYSAGCGFWRTTIFNNHQKSSINRSFSAILESRPKPGGIRNCFKGSTPWFPYHQIPARSQLQSQAQVRQDPQTWWIVILNPWLWSESHRKPYRFYMRIFWQSCEVVSPSLRQNFPFSIRGIANWQMGTWPKNSRKDAGC